MLVFHSWIAEYATVNNVTGNKVYFKEPLRHVPIGTYVPSSGWRFLIFNNMALLDMPGEYVCNDLGNGSAQFSYIPLEEQGCNSTNILKVEGVGALSPAHFITYHWIELRKWSYRSGQLL